jgi:hypothetical protein
MNSDRNRLAIGDTNTSWGDGLSPIERRSSTEVMQLSSMFDYKKSRSSTTGKQDMKFQNKTDEDLEEKSSMTIPSKSSKKKSKPHS